MALSGSKALRKSWTRYCMLLLEEGMGYLRPQPFKQTTLRKSIERAGSSAFRSCSDARGRSWGGSVDGDGALLHADPYHGTVLPLGVGALLATGHHHLRRHHHLAVAALGPRPVARVVVEARLLVVMVVDAGHRRAHHRRRQVGNARKNQAVVGAERALYEGAAVDGGWRRASGGRAPAPAAAAAAARAWGAGRRPPAAQTERVPRWGFALHRLEAAAEALGSLEHAAAPAAAAATDSAAAAAALSGHANQSWRRIKRYGLVSLSASSPTENTSLAYATIIRNSWTKPVAYSTSNWFLPTNCSKLKQEELFHPLG